MERYAFLGISAFIISAALDYLLARYAISIRDRLKWHAIFWGMMSTVAANVCLILIVEERWLLIPDIFGTGVGIWFAMRTDPEGGRVEAGNDTMGEGR